MKKQQPLAPMWAVLIVLIIAQAAVIFFLVQSKNDLTTMNQDLTSTTKELQNQIQGLSESQINLQTQLAQIEESVGSVSSAQSQLQNQLSQIKATTSADFSGIIEDATKGVVTIKTDVAQGSGFIITNEGYVVTNAHVLSGGNYINVYTSDGDRHRAELVGYDRNIDVALLKIEGDFHALELGDSEDAQIGERVIALGNPLGLSFTVTEGILSARDRTGTNRLPYYFQTDASLNPGNSGGPLIDTNGEVIGINNFKVSGADNIGFALEIEYARDAINEIAQAQLNQTIV